MSDLESIKKSFRLTEKYEQYRANRLWGILIVVTAFYNFANYLWVDYIYGFIDIMNINYSNVFNTWQMDLIQSIFITFCLIFPCIPLLYITTPYVFNRSTENNEKRSLKYFGIFASIVFLVVLIGIIEEGFHWEFWGENLFLPLTILEKGILIVPVIIFYLFNNERLYLKGKTWLRFLLGLFLLYICLFVYLFLLDIFIIIIQLFYENIILMYIPLTGTYNPVESLYFIPNFEVNTLCSSFGEILFPLICISIALLIEKKRRKTKTSISKIEIAKRPDYNLLIFSVLLIFNFHLQFFIGWLIGDFWMGLMLRSFMGYYYFSNSLNYWMLLIISGIGLLLCNNLRKMNKAPFSSKIQKLSGLLLISIALIQIPLAILYIWLSNYMFLSFNLILPSLSYLQLPSLYPLVSLINNIIYLMVYFTCGILIFKKSSTLLEEPSDE